MSATTSKKALVSPALLLAAGLLPAGQAPGDESGGAVLVAPAAPRGRMIASGEAHAWRVEAAGSPLLVTVEQLGIDLVVEVRGPDDQSARTIDGPTSRWGPEVVVLTAGIAGTYRLEVRPGGQDVPPGRYAIAVEPLETGDTARQAAAQAMSHASELVSSATPAALSLAGTSYREALEAGQAAGEPRWEAEAWHALAAVDQMRGDLRSAAAGYQEAAVLWRLLGDARREAAALNGLGRTLLDRGELDAARRTFTESVGLWQRTGERLEEGEVRINLCLVEQTAGAAQGALACYEEARALFQETGDPSQEARILNNMGGIHDALGEPDRALRSYEQALALRRRLGDRLGEAQILNNLGTVHRALGEWPEALRLYAEARQMLASLSAGVEEAKLLNNIGFAYTSLGEPQRALVSHQEALRLRRETGDRRGEVVSLNNLGIAWRSLGELQTSLDHHRRALEIASALGDPRQQAISRLRLAEALLDLGEPEAALRELGTTSTYLREAGDRRNEGLMLHLRGRALTLAGRPREALPLLEEALERRRAVSDRAGEADTLHALGAAARRLGLTREARAHAEAAVSRVEAMRSRFVSPNLRAAFLAAQRSAYSLLIDLLMDRHAAEPTAGHDRAALEVSERARARTLLDRLSERPGSAGAAANFGTETGLLERRRSLRRRLSAKTDQLLKQAGASAEALGREIEVLLTDLDGVEAEIRGQSPGAAGAGDPRPISLPEIAGLLDPETLLLEYSLGEERSFLWAVGAGTFRSFVLPPQREIEALARQVYQEVSTVEVGAGPQSSPAQEALAQILLAPVWSEAERGKRLVLVPDASLHLVPFAALPVPVPGLAWDAAGGPRQPLLERQEVVYLPSASTLALERLRLGQRGVAPKWAAVLADPVFAADDPRLAGPNLARRPAPAASALASTALERGAEAAGGPPLFERLPGSRREAEAIARLAPTGQVWTALDAAASRDAVLSGQLRTYRVVHFATHAIADTRNPERSGLVLSLVDAAGHPLEGFLGLPEIYELNLDADLAVLSGCQTALGREMRGEGLMGLTRGFLYAGVPRVVASLWRVQDRATADLMSHFYRALWRDGLPPAAALHAAQRSLRRDPRYRDPYSWAGFVLQGEWR